jgi:hypothetical protein
MEAMDSEDDVRRSKEEEAADDDEHLQFLSCLLALYV